MKAIFRWWQHWRQRRREHRDALRRVTEIRAAKGLHTKQW